MRRALTQISRAVHNSHLPAGTGGRSSWAGKSAALFGCTGHVGYKVANVLGKNGFAAVLPSRKPETVNENEGADEFKPMFDLGQYFVNEDFSIKPEFRDDDYLRDMIRHTNVVINVIGSRKEMNFYTMGEVNFDWPTRLARLVAEKNDDTILVHLVHMNTHDEDSRKESVILEQQHNAERVMRELYPQTIIVRSSFAFGAFDHYGDVLTNWRWNNFKELGSWPVLYNGGKRTYHRSIPSADLAEALIRIVKHPDSPGHTFELYNEARHELADIVNLLYEAQQDEAFLFQGIQTKWVDGKRTLEPLNKFQKFKQDMFRNRLGYYTAPRPIPRFVDMMNRTDFTTNGSFGFINEHYYNMLNQSCKIENADNPGLKDLGIIPSLIEDNAMQMMERWVEHTYKVNNKFILKNSPLPQYPEGSENAHKVAGDPKDYQYLHDRREYDLNYGQNYKWQNELRDEWAKISSLPERNTIEMRPNHYIGGGKRRNVKLTDTKDVNPYALF